MADGLRVLVSVPVAVLEGEEPWLGVWLLVEVAEGEPEGETLGVRLDVRLGVVV